MNRHYAPAKEFKDPVRDTNLPTILGTLPHQLRGFLSHYTTWSLLGHKYKHCTACSLPVLNKFQSDGIEFLVECCRDPGMVEDISGVRVDRDVCVDDVLDFEEMDEDGVLI